MENFTEINDRTAWQSLECRDKNVKSLNQRLAGPANPRTLIAPVVVPPSADLDWWKANNFVVHSHINDSTHVDNYSSGYVGRGCHPHGHHAASGHHADGATGSADGATVEGYENVPYVMLEPRAADDTHIIAPSRLRRSAAAGRRDVTDSCGGWHPGNLRYNLPVNAMGGDKKSIHYNGEIYTQTLEPDTFIFNQRVQPINSMLGISHTPPYEAITKKEVENGTYFTEHDPNVIEPLPRLEGKVAEVSEANMFDPRSDGYGTSYRAYTDDLLGQTKFMYDDIDNVRAPKYISRNKIDWTDFGNGYGKMSELDGQTTRRLVNKTWFDNTSEFRQDMMARLMRKRNTEMAQLRKMPHSQKRFTPSSTRIF